MRSCCIFYLLKCEYKCCVKRNGIVNNPLKCPLVFGRNCGSGYPTPAARWWRWLTYCCITPFYSQFWKGEIPNALKSLAWQINRKCIGLNPVVMLQGREHADMCRGGPAAFHIFFNREKVKFWETPPIIFLFVRVIFTLSWHYKDDKVNGMVCFSSFRFVCDYDEQFPIADDVSLLQQAMPVMYLYQLFLWMPHNSICCS